MRNPFISGWLSQTLQKHVYSFLMNSSAFQHFAVTSSKMAEEVSRRAKEVTMQKVSRRANDFVSTAQKTFTSSSSSPGGGGKTGGGGVGSGFPLLSGRSLVETRGLIENFVRQLQQRLKR